MAKTKRAITITLPIKLVDELDELSTSVSMSRTQVCVKILAKHVPILLEARKQQLAKRAQAGVEEVTT